MSYTMTAQVIGADELKRAFAQHHALAVKEFSTAVGKTALKVEGDAKRGAPVDTGFLRGSITTKGPNATFDNVEASVGTNLKYARNQEEGTGIYGPKKRMIVPIKGKWLAWQGGGNWHFAKQVRGVKPQRYFKKALDGAMPYFVDQMQAALERITTALTR